jgi:hypothetical protein
MVEEGAWWEVLEVSRMANNSSQKFMFGFYLYMGFVVLLFKSEYPDFWELRRTATVHWIYKVDHINDGCGSL